MFGLGNSQAGIGLAVTLHDRFTQNARKVSREMGNMKRGATSMMRTNSKIAASAAGLTVLGYGITRFMGDSMKMSNELNKTMSLSQAITGSTDKQIAGLKNSFMDMSVGIGYSTKALAEMGLEASRAGIHNIADQLKMVPEFAKLSKLTGSDPTKTLEYGTDIMQAFGKGADETALYAAKMGTAANSANMTFLQLAEGMKYASTTAKMTGYSMEETMAMMGALSNVGLKGSKAGTATNNFMIRLNKAASQYRTKRQTQGLTAMGLKPSDIQDAAGNAKSLLSVMDTLQSKMSKMTGPQAAAHMEAIFGVRGSRGSAAGFASKMGLTMRKMIEIGMDPDIVKKWGDAYTKFMDKPEQSAEKLKIAWDNFKTTLGGPLADALHAVTPLLLKLLKGFTWLAKTDIGKVLIVGVAALGGLALVFGPILMMMSTMTMLLGSWPGIFSKIARAAGRGFGRMVGGDLTPEVDRHGNRRYKRKGKYAKRNIVRSAWDSVGDFVGGGGKHGGKLRNAKAFGKMKFLRPLLRFGRWLLKIGPLLATFWSAIVSAGSAIGTFAAAFAWPITLIIAFAAALWGVITMLGGFAKTWEWIKYGFATFGDMLMHPWSTMLKDEAWEKRKHDRENEYLGRHVAGITGQKLSYEDTKDANMKLQMGTANSRNPSSFNNANRWLRETQGMTKEQATDEINANKVRAERDFQNFNKFGGGNSPAPVQVNIINDGITTSKQIDKDEDLLFPNQP